MFALEVIVAQNKVGDARAKTTPLHSDSPAANHYKHRYPQMHESVLEFECDGCMEVVPDSEYDSDNKKCKDCV